MRYLLLAPLLFLSIFLFGQKSNEDPPVIESPPLIEQPSVFQFVESMPEFPGGEVALMKFIQKNLEYPDSARKHNIEGKVLVSFIIDVDGSVTEIKVKRGVAWDLDKEAIRVVGLLPKFKPGKQQGKAVRVKFYLPISFRLS